jgi:hypothetical protein
MQRVATRVNIVISERSERVSRKCHEMRAKSPPPLASLIRCHYQEIRKSLSLSRKINPHYFNCLRWLESLFAHKHVIF